MLKTIKAYFTFGYLISVPDELPLDQPKKNHYFYLYVFFITFTCAIAFAHTTF